MTPFLGFNPDPSLCCAIGAAVSALLYTVGLSRLWRKAGVGRGARVWQAVCFAAGWCAAALPGITSLHLLGRQVFALHMIEHEILMTVAAPLLVASMPLPVFLWALPSAVRPAIGALGRSAPVRSVWYWMTDPRIATLLQGIALWAWHWPPAFQSALLREPVHTAQHLSFFITALLFWRALFTRRTGTARAVLALFGTTLHTSLLGAWVTFSRGFWYSEPYLGAFCGLTRAEDQQLAGLIMWIPAGVIYLAAAIGLLTRALAESPVNAFPTRVLSRARG